MKKRIAILLALVICALAFGAFAAPEKALPVTVYDSLNDVPAWVPQEHARPGMEPYEPSGYFDLRGILPQADGGALLTGQYVYYDISIEESFEGGFEFPPPRTDAYAIRVDSDGKRVWSLRIGDPQSEGNTFSPAWMLPDGRTLLRFGGSLGTFGTQYYIINEDGQIDETLPNKALRAAGAVDTLALTDAGYVFGGYRREGDMIAPMEEGDVIGMLDENLAPLWTISDPALAAAFLTRPPRVAEDGLLFCGENFVINGRPTPLLVKLTLDGKIAFVYKGHEYSYTNFCDAVPTADGGALATSYEDPTKATPYEGRGEGTLTKFDKDGKVEWVKSYLEHGFFGLQQIYPLGEGYVMMGSYGEDNRSDSPVLLYTDAAGEPLGMLALPKGDSPDHRVWSTHATLTEAADGTIWVYGNKDHYSEFDGGLWKVDVAEAFYGQITPESFAP